MNYLLISVFCLWAIWFLVDIVVSYYCLILRIFLAAARQSLSHLLSMLLLLKNWNWNLRFVNLYKTFYYQYTVNYCLFCLDWYLSILLDFLVYCCFGEFYVYVICLNFVFVGVLYYIGATVNPLLYNLMSKKYRMAFKRTLCRCIYTQEELIELSVRSKSVLVYSDRTPI
jgi:hypothetical protein